MQDVKHTRPSVVDLVAKAASWRASTGGTVLALILGASAATGAQPMKDPPRYHLDARLEAAGELAADARFSLRAGLEPRHAGTAQESFGLALKAILASTEGPICQGPGHLFADGFEVPQFLKEISL